MTTYRLPEALGGGEYEGSIEERLAGVIRLNFVGRAIYVPADMLTEIKPPIPAEPGVGAYMLDKRLCMRTGHEAGKCHVYETGGMWAEDTFAHLWEKFGGPDVTITPLVPSVPVEPVQLPWVEGPFEVFVRSEPAALCSVVLRHAYRNADMVMPPQRARSMAAALLSAADRSDR